MILKFNFTITFNYVCGILELLTGGYSIILQGKISMIFLRLQAIAYSSTLLLLLTLHHIHRVIITDLYRLCK